MQEIEQKDGDLSRSARMRDWLQNQLVEPPEAISLLAGDASFRRYFRVLSRNGGCYVLMDAPPQKENAARFVEIAQLLQANQVNVPMVLAQDLQQGFLLLTDFGDCLYFDILNSETADVLYDKAFETLVQLQRISDSGLSLTLPSFGQMELMRELMLFFDWYLVKYQGINVSPLARKQLFQLFDQMISAILVQPQTFVHRDYHSRNLMLTQDNQVGVLDFQDAVWGPITYDAVSLLRDCYIAWDKRRVAFWLQRYYYQLHDTGLLGQTSFATFCEWFDLTGLQRHLKCLGIFARLHLRDQKSAYLAAIPRVKQYVYNVCQKYPLFSLLTDYLRDQG